MASGEQPTRDSAEIAAEAWGRDGHRQGVGLDAARAYSDTPRIQAAWRRGWLAADAAALKTRGLRADERFWIYEAKRRGL